MFKLMEARRIADAILRGLRRVGIKPARELAEGFILCDRERAELYRKVYDLSREHPKARLLHTGEGRVVVAFSLSELATIARDTLNIEVRERVLCAIGLLDETMERELRE